ncbi:PQQ-binding-like beta-propeller repeat protein [Urbifossiella limnaea]|uniref:Outer membrane biogenesis protein BamB n=1 Tax=Urbifossiella limnaea TaxID=2528023 RepID=A0A517XSZ7_9BACT|nr:PQQ-binding-like beta-propeller repeat protein [Urbifossiella limnaea]QDU20615.1 outer membrane biogenesis protein BamB [Urbifossiella limnaea]
MLRRAALLLALAPTLALAADWPQFRGPARDGHSADTGLLKSWPAGGPKLLWTFAEGGVGYAGPAVVGDRLYTCGGKGGDEYVYALDLTKTPAAVLWSAKIGPLFTWQGNSWNAGPSVTPTVDGDRVYALGGFGDLVCVEAKTGKELWRANYAKDFGGEVNPIGGGLTQPSPLGWGNSAAPLVDGSTLVCVVGGKRGLFAGLDKTTGKLLWRSADVPEQAPYSSPVAAKLGGVPQYVSATNKGLVGVGLKGELLWRHDRATAFDDVVISTPVVRDGVVAVSVGFGEGIEAVTVAPGAGGKLTATKQYASKEIQNRDGGLVLLGDHLYGHSEQGGWVCAEFKTGKVLWTEGKALGRGVISAADGKLYCAAEKGGAVVLLDAATDGWKEAGRLSLPATSKLRKPQGMLWTHPVVANGHLYIRDQELLFCYAVKG